MIPAYTHPTEDWECGSSNPLKRTDRNKMWSFKSTQSLKEKKKCWHMLHVDELEHTTLNEISRQNETNTLVPLCDVAVTVKFQSQW